MKVPNSEHTSRPWRVREIASDFKLLDVWALPVQGGAAEFDDLIELMTSADPADIESLPARSLWWVRDVLGALFGLGRTSVAVDAGPTALAERLPDDLRSSADDVRFAALPFVPLYRTDTEFVGEVSNRTVHGLMHLGWVEQGDGTFTGQMAVYVKPRGVLGAGYMKLIEPFRHFVVYPALMRQMEREWAERDTRRKQA